MHRLRPVAAMIGGGLLAAWIPFWAFVSSVSTFDFMRTAGGHPSIGTFFLPPGLADGVTVIGIALMVAAFIWLAGNRTSNGSGKATVPVTPEKLASGLEIRFCRDSPYRLEKDPYTQHRIGIYNLSEKSAEYNVAVNLRAISPLPRAQIFSADFPHHYNTFNLNPKEEQLIEVARSWVSGDGRLMIGGIDKLDRAIPIEKDECWQLEISVTSASRPAQVATFVLRPSSSPIVFDRLT